ncbi:MAG: NAD(P)-dependent glycerol-1-phosphate dehydrogenase [Euryarchaeota archaeon]|nr:NAD(P)-dependent glycerol-1-phosphate dehydrogenase [Euryarchaeota archaeon]MDE1836253.1 NAD(P)-dependent glycerol-1-phosphate dehydrogenase [Euryarchaeota archaeon]MDE2044986.1 NAD(P)-dependent glycerol-1-phosphate dehydrogenase [Thermoplasmata archaeon]
MVTGGASPLRAAATAAGGPLEDFHKVRTMNFPRTVLAGHGVLEELPKICQTLGFVGPGAVITGPTTQAIAGDRVGHLLESSGLKVRIIPAGDATLDEVARIASEVEQQGIRFLVGVGGGSKIDLAKTVAARQRIPFISVPTSAAHDGISSPRASLKGSREAFSIEAAVPEAIVADTSVLVRAPYRYLAAGCADVISNVTAVLDWQLAHRLRNEDFASSSAALAEYAAHGILDHARDIRPGKEESVWIAIRPIIMSGIAMSMAGSSRPSSGSEHLFAHALERIAPGRALHGEVVGLGTIMMAYLHNADWKSLRVSLKEIGAPTTAHEANVERDEVLTALVNAHTLRPERYTILGDNGLSREAAERLASQTEVI